MKANLRSRGFTLLELIIASAIMLMGVAMAGAALSLQNKALQSTELTRVANAAARDATLSIEGNLRRAGWGVDPRFAIDLFNGAAATFRTNRSVDSTSASDELGFLARDPMYHWTDDGQLNPDGSTCSTAGGCYLGHSWAVSVPVGAAPRTLAVTIAVGQSLYIEKGRLMLVTCVGAENPVILSSAALHNIATVATETTENVATNSTAAFPFNDTGSLRACHSSAGASLFLIDRFRYHVSGSWLMLDTGVDLNEDGTIGNAADLIPIAGNVEDLQVAYVLGIGTGTAPDSTNNDWIIGNSSGNTELPVPPGSAAAPPTYTTPLDDASRLTTTASANVRAIRVSLLLRSFRADPNMDSSFAGETVPYPENRTGQASGGGFRRYSYVSEINLRNMESSRPFTF